jgi:acyl-coenzyme A synthetase/AMP-(fatty) acid ligase
MQYTVYSVLNEIPSVITFERLTSELWIDIVDRHKVTIVFASMALAGSILRSKNLKKLDSVRIFIMGGSVFPEKMIRDLEKIFPNGKVMACYGSTETDFLSAPSELEGTFGQSSGYPYYNTDIKIVGEHGVPFGPNEVGDIYCKTLVPCSGYHGDSNLFSESFDNSGFMKIGDAGYFDDCGRIYVIDRIKHMIKSVGSHKVTPIEIQSIINEIDGVIQSCVVGVFDEEVFYDKIHAFVIKDQARDDLTEDFIVNYVNCKVIEQKKISGGVHFVDKFPTTPTGKVLNRELKKMAETMRQSG